MPAGDSPPRLDRSHPCRVRGCGVDTWRPSWYVDPEGDAAQWFVGNGMPAGAAAGGGFQLADPIAEHRVGMAASGMIWAEGHPVAGRLAKAGELQPAYDALTAALLDAGVPVPAGRRAELVDRHAAPRRWRHGSPPVPVPHVRRPGAAGLARLDVTADFATPSALYGRAWMRALSAVALQRGKTTVHGSLGAQETVALRSPGGRRVLGRVYDKGLESLEAPPFRLLRAEDQGRFPAARRRGIEDIDAAYLRERFRRRFAPIMAAGREFGMVTVAEPLVLCTRINELLAEGVLKPSQATRMAGNVILDYVAADQRRGSRTTVWRHRGELIKYGLIRDTGELAGEPIELRPDEPFELVSQLSIWQ